MPAQQFIRDGNLIGALTALQNAVRKNAADVKLRIFLFQLLAVLGQWSRALTQLNLAGELDASTLPMVQTYREAIVKHKSILLILKSKHFVNKIYNKKLYFSHTSIEMLVQIVQI